MGDRLTYVFLWFWGLDEPQKSLRLIGNMEYKHHVFVCVISYSIQQFHLIKHSSPLAMDSWTPPRPDGSPSDHPLWSSPDHK